MRVVITDALHLIWGLPVTGAAVHLITVWGLPFTGAMHLMDALRPHSALRFIVASCQALLPCCPVIGTGGSVSEDEAPCG